MNSMDKYIGDPRPRMLKKLKEDNMTGMKEEFKQVELELPNGETICMHIDVDGIVNVFSVPGRKKIMICPRGSNSFRIKFD